MYPRIDFYVYGPSMDKDFDTSDSSESQEAEKKKTRSSGDRCVVMNCSSTFKTATIHRMPGPMPAASGRARARYSSVQMAWIRFVQRHRVFDPTKLKHIPVCSLHFDETQYNQTQLGMFKMGMRKRPPQLLPNSIPHIYNFVSESGLSVPADADEDVTVFDDTSLTGQAQGDASTSSSSSFIRKRKQARAVTSYIRKKEVAEMTTEYSKKALEESSLKLAKDILERCKGHKSSITVPQKKTKHQEMRSKRDRKKQQQHAARTAHAQYQKKETRNCQVASSDDVHHVTSHEQSQDDTGEMFTVMDIKTEPKDECEPEETREGQGQVKVESPTGVSHDQQTPWSTSLTFEIKCEGDHDGQYQGMDQSEEPQSTSQRMDALPNMAETWRNCSMESLGTVLKGSDIKRKPRKCDVCHKVLRRMDRLQGTSDNYEDGPIKCDVCLKDVTHTDELPKAHNSDITSKNPALDHANLPTSSMKDDTECDEETSAGTIHHSECQVYQKNCVRKGSFTEQMRTQTGEKPHKCKSCSKEFSHRASLRRHIRMEENPCICNLCSKAYSTNTNLQRHMRTHTGEKPYKCNLCSKAFCTKSELPIHMRTHTGEKQYKCNLCSKAYSTNSQLKRHIRNHSGKKQYECKLCSKAFLEKTNLNAHLKTHTGDKQYKCTLCSKTYGAKCHLQIHMRTHTGEKPFECKLCSKAYCSNSQLQRHIRNHSGEKLHKCEFCSKAFQEKNILNIHMKTHADEKPYKCNLCSKAFSTLSTLKSHMGTHTGEKRYRCKLCSKAFRAECKLNTHMRTHTGEKPYKCNLCPKAFSQSYNLKIHMRTHTGEKTYECKLCSKAYCSNNQLQRHIQNHSGEKNMI